MPEATLHDASTIAVEVQGRSPTVLLPVNPRPVEGPQAEEMRRWGNDPALGRSLIDGLADAFRVVAFDYEGHVFQVPKPDTLTPDNVAGDFLATAYGVSFGTWRTGTHKAIPPRTSPRQWPSGWTPSPTGERATAIGPPLTSCCTSIV